MRIEDANLPEPRQRCEGKTPTLKRCWHVATITAHGKRLCVDYAKKVKT